MTQIYITIGIIAIIALLVCYVFIRQTLGERQQERERLQRILIKRAKDLLQMINVFPDNFLPTELLVFIYRCIIDAYEQLTKLVPDEKQYVSALQVHSAQLESVIRKPAKKKTEELQSSAQINELRQYLNLLGSFLQKSMERQHITSKQHSHYKMLLKELIITLAVNNYKLTAKQANDNGKARLAIHYYELAKNLLLRDTPSGYNEQVKIINGLMEPLQEQEEKAKLSQQVQKEEEAQNATQEQKDEWSEFEEEAGWQKKNVYD